MRTENKLLHEHINTRRRSFYISSTVLSHACTHLASDNHKWPTRSRDQRNSTCEMETAPTDFPDFLTFLP